MCLTVNAASGQYSLWSERIAVGSVLPGGRPFGTMAPVSLCGIEEPQKGMPTGLTNQIIPDCCEIHEPFAAGPAQ